MKKLKEKIDELVINVLLEVTDNDLDIVNGGCVCYGCPTNNGF